MRRIYISTVRRVPTYDVDDCGFLYVLDWDTKSLVCDPILIWDARTPNDPKSRTHGARGITCHNDQIYVAGSGRHIDNIDHYGKISIFDRDNYRFVKTLRFADEFSGIHQIRDYNGYLYVVSTGNDRVYRMKNDTIVDFTSVETIAGLLPPLDRPWGQDRVHFNSIGWDASGNEYHVYLSAQAVVNFTKKKVILQGEEHLSGAHDMCFVQPYKAIINLSDLHRSILLDVRTGEYDTILQLPDIKHQNAEWADLNRPRGSAYDSTTETAFICATPGHMYCYDVNTWEQVDYFSFTKDVREGVFDMLLDPRDWT